MPGLLIFNDCPLLLLQLLVIPGGLVTIGLSRGRVSCLHLLEVGLMLLLSSFHGLGVRLVSRLGHLRVVCLYLDDVSAVSLDHFLVLVSKLLLDSLLLVEKLCMLFVSGGLGLVQQLLKLLLLLGHRVEVGLTLFLLVAGQICQVLHVLVSDEGELFRVVLDKTVGRLRVVVVTSGGLLSSRPQHALVTLVRRGEVVVESSALDVEGRVRIVQSGAVCCGLLLSLTDKSIDGVLLALDLRGCISFLRLKLSL